MDDVKKKGKPYGQYKGTSPYKFQSLTRKREVGLERGKT